MLLEELEASLDEIRSEMDTLIGANEETKRSVGIKQIGIRTHRLKDEVEQIENVSDILVLEDALEKEDLSVMGFTRQTRCTGERMRLGTIT